MARELNITHNQLASIEYGRVPLRYRLGKVLCDACHISQRWLATGALPMRVFVEVHEYHEAHIPDDMLFSQAYDTFLSKLIEQEFTRLARNHHCDAAELDKHRRKMGIAWPVGSPNSESARIYHERLLTWRLSKQPDEVQKKIFRELNSVLDQLMPGIQGKDILDYKKSSDTLTSMKSEVPTWPELKEDIKNMTAERGAKKALADEIKVSRQVLGNWLSDDAQGAPNADLTLELLKRVQQWKRKK